MENWQKFLLEQELIEATEEQIETVKARNIETLKENFVFARPGMCQETSWVVLVASSPGRLGRSSGRLGSIMVRFDAILDECTTRQEKDKA